MRPCLENLEERATPATITVTTTSDAVAANFVTLREAIQSMNAGRNIDANVNADVTMNAYGTNDTILFAIPNGGQVIQPTVANGELPAIAKAVTIDGGNAVKIDGGLFLPANKINGLTVTGSGVTIQNLTVQSFTGNGVLIVGNNNAVNYCIIDENAFNGIYITGNTNKVIGCFIGTDSQTADKGNGAFGVEIYGGTRNDFGPSTPAGPDNIAAADRNFISRNKGGGVAITGTGVDSMTPQDNVVGNNDIGVSDTLGGTTGNGGPGVVLTGQAHGNLIGYQLLGGVGGENVIAGNAGSGVVIENASPSNQISGNLIGIRDGGVRTGEVVGNHGYGVKISDAVEGNSNCNTIGGTIGTLPRGEQNVISGNTEGGSTLRAR